MKESSGYCCRLWKQTPPFETFSHSTTSSACAGWRTHALKLTRMRTLRRLFTGRPLLSNCRAGTSWSFATWCAAFVAGGAVTGSGACSTAVALGTTVELWISDNEANSDVADEAEYDDGPIEPEVRDSSSTGSKDSADACVSKGGKVGLDVFGAGEYGGEFKFGLAGRASGPGRTSPTAFFQGVDVPHSSQ